TGLLSLRGAVLVRVGRSTGLHVCFVPFTPDLLRNIIVLPHFRGNLHWIRWVTGDDRRGFLGLEFNCTLLRTVRYDGVKISNHLEIPPSFRMDCHYAKTLFVWNIRDFLDIIGVGILDKQ